MALAALLVLSGLAWSAPAALARPQAPAAVGTPTRPLSPSSEALAAASPWSRPESYPLTLRPPAALYRPSAPWIGRLILPTPAEAQAAAAPREDWVWIELEQAPADRQALIGQRLRLRWADRAELRRLVDTVTTTIQLGEPARQAAAAANVVPTRLDGRRVGPLQSLAGARPSDTVTVLLEGVTPEADSLRIARPPVQISGRWQARVSVLGAADGPDLWKVRHYDRAAAGFRGPVETIRIPALPPDRFGRRLLDPAGLAASALNPRGWLIQGAPAADGVFTVQALLPYALLEPRPDRVVRGTEASLASLRREIWSPASLRRGSEQSAALLPDGETAPPWRIGERALLMHLFGGIGGEDGEPIGAWTVTGHFAFGEAEVVRDPFSDRPRLALRYHQIYANNPNGIVSGSQDWSAYAGSLQRGWIGLRPFADLLIPMGAEVLDAIDLQAELMAARYRSGDGSGVALVTPSTSCVQDSAQALWIAIQQLRQEASPVAMSAVERERLRELGLAFDRLLEPFGRVRSDWRRNAASALAAGTGAGGRPVAGARRHDPFVASQNLRDALLSWRSLLPRSAHDLFTREFLRVGLPVQVLRSNQIPGADPRLEPLAPTALFGQLPGVDRLLGRLGDGLFPLRNPSGQIAGAAILLASGGLALARARRAGRRLGWAGRAAPWLLVQAFLEELLFRGLLLPSALEGVKPWAMLPWLAWSVGLFVAWRCRGLWCWRHVPRGSGSRWGADAALQASGLGSACALIYWASGSLWWAVLLHGLAALAVDQPAEAR